MTLPPQSYRLIPLTQGQFAKVSPHRYEELSKHKWHAQWDKNSQGFYANCWAVVVIDGKRKYECIAMHRQILNLLHGDKRQGDHWNGDTLDNRDENLRVATRQQNQWNSRRKRSTSGYKGAYFHKRDNKWIARIRVNGTNIQIGRFSDPHSAHEAYCAAAKRYFGDFMNPG